jgi:hypothetical protein
VDDARVQSSGWHGSGAELGTGALEDGVVQSQSSGPT